MNTTIKLTWRPSFHLLLLPLLTLLLASRAEAETARPAWIRTYDAQGSQPSNGYGDEAADVAVDKNGDVVVTGQSTIPMTNGSNFPDFYTAKYSGIDGTILWERRYDGGNQDIPLALALDSQGNVAVTGFSILPRVPGQGEGYDFYTAKYAASDGHLIWARTHDSQTPGSDRDEPGDVATDAAGNVVVTGYVTKANPAGYQQLYTIKYAADTGATLWEKSYVPGEATTLGDPSLGGSDVAIDPAGNVVILGELGQSFNGTQLYVAKYDGSTGSLLWEKFVRGSFPSRTIDGARAELALDRNGDVLIGTFSLPTGQFTLEEAWIYAAKFSGANGTIVWQKDIKHAGRTDEIVKAIAVDAQDNVLVAGRSKGDTHDVYTAKLAGGDGQVIWENFYDSPFGSTDDGDAMAVDPEGNVFVTAHSAGQRGSDDALTLKYRADGTLAWSKRYVPPRDSAHPAAVAPTLDGGAVIAGRTTNNGRWDFLTVKYSPSAQPLNIATRMPVGTGDNALFAGFIVAGDVPKKVLIRAIGPSLPLGGKLADPTLELNKNDGTKVFNDNWKNDQRGEIEATTIPPSHDLEAAIVATLPPGPHTAIVRGTGGTSGTAVVEVYDLDERAASSLVNISSRGLVQTGDNILIGGFIVDGGNTAARVLIRAIGPSLPLAGVLQDPTLELVDQNGNVTANDNWRSTQESEIVATTIPPTNNNEAAILATLLPGNYTAVVRGKNNTTGIAVVEAYNMQ